MTNFKILSASAGTGKTYRLAKAYLICLLSSDLFSLRSQLALTFTNKAVGEMKRRILDNLHSFAFGANPEKKNTLFNEVAETLKLSETELKAKSKIALKQLLHNYAFFDVSTIDGFNHRIIRTFAKDLKIAQNFEVELDTDFVLGLVVSRVLGKAGVDEKLTKVLIDFSLEKIEDNKSWDIAHNLHQIGELIFNEKHLQHIDNLKLKSSEDFFELKRKLQKNRATAKDFIISAAKQCLEEISSIGLNFSDFNGAYFPKFLEQAQKNPDEINFDAKWKQNFGAVPLYKKTTTDTAKEKIDTLMTVFESHFKNIKKSFFQCEFLRRCEKHISPLSLLSEIVKEFENLKDEQGFLTIPEFNQLIYKELKRQPVPYIYERLGERYQNYFIDEFQDTSTLQWNNLVPLISHALESQNEKGHAGSLFLVGDVKQSIYRWRGGEPKQFLDLIFQNENPFTVEPNIEQLPKNWRSYDEIINFNNEFFTYIADKLSNKKFAKAYLEGNQQQSNNQKGGVVSISFVPKESIDLKEVSPHSPKTVEIIQTIIAAGYSLSDICVLVRSRNEGIEIAGYLQQQNFAVNSSEALLLRNNNGIRFIISFLKIIVNPNSREDCFAILEYLTEKRENAHDFIQENLNVLSRFLHEQYGLNLANLKGLSLIDCVQKLILTFNLAQNSSAFINFFVDAVFEFENKQQGTLEAFLDFWSLNEDKLAITSNEGENAITIMTIHKAKGLEFPFVIYPFANSIVNDSRKQDDIWFKVEPETNAGFSELLVTNNKYMEHYSEFSRKAFIEENQKSELDDFNVLYVALTRAIYGLYIICTEPSHNFSTKKDAYNSLFYEFLTEKTEFNSVKNEFVLGQLEPKKIDRSLEDGTVILKYGGSSFADQTIEVVVSERFISNQDVVASIEFGNLVHKALSKVYTWHDTSLAVKELLDAQDVSESEAMNLEETLNKVVNHETLHPFFKEGAHVKNEIEILLGNGTLLRPDKLVIKDGRATLIDYKTGVASPSHQKQLEEYADCLTKMGYIIDQKILVYINKDINTLAF